MKKAKKTLLLVLCALLLVSASVLGTLAYLTDSDSVTNTFTVGSVHLTLDETDVKTDGTKDTDARVQENEYHLIPGSTYIKDPTIHVASGSESCYVFVKVENGIAAYEAETETDVENGYVSVADQLTSNGWTALDGVENVYYQTYTKGTNGDLVVFEEFKIDGLANDVEGWETADDAKINVTGYAVQKSGFNTANAAWNATFGKNDKGVEVTPSDPAILDSGSYDPATGWSTQNGATLFLRRKFNAGDVVTVEYTGSNYLNIWNWDFSWSTNVEGSHTFTIATPQTCYVNTGVADPSATLRMWVKSAE